ncbi:MAG TPA: hypothetical protein DEA96_15230 [Leptospiraceae bacterium]|nr:hypothetical protein [Spirochaetaceae bacterium]HBS06319.1 hypothetical protein [Leptospiraceae bacterium]
MLADFDGSARALAYMVAFASVYLPGRLCMPFRVLQSLATDIPGCNVRSRVATESGSRAQPSCKKATWAHSFPEEAPHH